MAGTEGRPTPEPTGDPDRDPATEPLADAPPAPEPPAKPQVEPLAEPGTEPGPAAGGEEPPERRERRGPDWDRVGKRILIWLGVAIAVVALYFLLASFLPRWWAQRMGNLVDGSFALGVWWGLFFGALFTALPIMVVWLAFRREMAWKLRLVIIGVAILLAAPNLLTLSVVLGTNNAAHAGERILDVDAPAFRGATLAGVIIGAVLAVGLMLLFAGYRRRGRKIRQLEEKR